DEFTSGKIDLDSTVKLFEKLHMPFDFAHVKHAFKKTVDKRKENTINMEDFRSIYRTIVHRPEFQELFRIYSPNNKVLVDTELIDFLKKEQYETEGCETMALEIILKYEPIEEGCRCLEIDCWDGSNNEPVVYHGHTLTSKILFHAVIQVVDKYAFTASDYPVVLSLENHCSPKQQEVIAEHLQNILGDKLLTSTLGDPDVTELPSPEMKKKKLALALSDLVIYTKSQKFVSFEHSLENQKCYENNSIGEVRARKFIKNSVALNFQTPGVQMELQNGKFLDNGGCGYILKPEFLRNRYSTFTPQNVGRYSNPMSLSIKLISGHQLPPSNLSKTNKADPLVHVEIYGVPEDQTKKKSSVVKSNALCPRWDETFSFTVQVPELALIRFCVKDEISLVSNEFLGQYTLPVMNLSKGYRKVPLLSKDGSKLEPASLFVHIWYY
ncbi:hypothetical protein Q9233_002538, partial [Columba guinea]